MKVKTEVARRGRPRGNLRNWYSENLPKLKPTKVSEAKKLVEVSIPVVGKSVTVEIPKGYTAIPTEFTSGKTQATVGQTARNEAKGLNIKDKRFVVHEIPTVVEDGRGKKKQVHEFSIFAVETTEA